MGYKQELKRNFSTLEVFGIAFSIISLLPSIASTLSYSVPAGPVGMVWVRIGFRIHIQDSYLLKSRAGSFQVVSSFLSGLQWLVGFVLPPSERN